jgi:hypothetical protein
LITEAIRIEEQNIFSLMGSRRLEVSPMATYNRAVYWVLKPSSPIGMLRNLNKRPGQMSSAFLGTMVTI